ncbi:hypothetical protein ScPMuIL_001833 [Solemya velum]
MTIPGAVLAGSWIPFVVVLLLILLFSSCYVRYFTSKYDSTVSTTLSSVFALTVTLLTTALVPVDIFLVSFMKTSDGYFKDWANSSSERQSVEDSVAYTYYALYALVTFCIFMLVPFMYFFYEEKDEETTNKQRCCRAFMFTLVFLLIVVVLLLIGAFVPKNNIPNANSTEWQKIQSLFNQLGTNDGEDALSFVMSSLSLIGMLSLILYTGYGMSALPIGMIKGYRSARKERLEVQNRRKEAQNRIQALRDKYSGGTPSSRDRQRLTDLEESEHLMERQDTHLSRKNTGCLEKCCFILRPFEIIIGVVFLLLALLIFLSLLLTNIDKAMHSLGYKLGYALPKRTLPNPVDIVLVYCQMVFPLDYILFDVIVMYLVLCSISGIRNIGVWFCWLKMYNFRPRRTRPQGILLMCMILMFILLAVDIIIYELTPQYSSFGSQHYVVETKNGSSHELMPCGIDAPQDQCTISRMSLLLTRLFYKMWFFGAAYYWATWVFLGVFLIGFVVVLVRKRKSAINGEVEQDDFDESDDDEMLRP